MDKKSTCDYFYGGQSEAFSYYRLPCILVTGQQFRGLSTDAKLLYALLRNRMGLSSRNGWYDDQGRVYIYLSVQYEPEDVDECLNRPRYLRRHPSHLLAPR